MLPNHNKNFGFTLLEIIIALFVFSIVSMIVASALHNILNTQAVLEKKAARLAELQIALLFLSRDLEQVIDRPVTTPTGGLQGFIGAPNSVTFTHTGLANPFGTLQRSTLQRTRYQLNDSTLVRITWPTLDPAQEENMDTRSLLTSVSELRFEYLDNKNHFQKIWPPLDQANAALPRAIRVSLTLSEWGKISELYIVAGQSIEQTH